MILLQQQSMLLIDYLRIEIETTLYVTYTQLYFWHLLRNCIFRQARTKANYCHCKRIEKTKTKNEDAGAKM